MHRLKVLWNSPFRAGCLVYFYVLIYDLANLAHSRRISFHNFLYSPAALFFCLFVCLFCSIGIDSIANTIQQKEKTEPFYSFIEWKLIWICYECYHIECITMKKYVHFLCCRKSGVRSRRDTHTIFRGFHLAMGEQLCDATTLYMNFHSIYIML